MKDKQGETQETPRREEREEKERTKDGPGCLRVTRYRRSSSVYMRLPHVRDPERRAGRQGPTRWCREVCGTPPPPRGGKRWTSLVCSGSLHLVSDALHSPCMFHAPRHWLPATDSGLSKCLTSLTYESSIQHMSQQEQRWMGSLTLD